jgi:alpha-tubulin suppressor-like RCC1 family protein
MARAAAFLGGLVVAACGARTGLVGGALGDDGGMVDGATGDASDASSPEPPKLALGMQHTCLVGKDGSVRCWGRNDHGQLGDGTTVDRHAPTLVAGVSGVRSVAAGYLHTCALLEDGTARCWGALADAEVHAPRAVDGLANAAELAAGDDFTCARLADGAARCWGTNDAAQLGDGTIGGSRAAAAPVTGLAGVRSIAAGRYHACAVLETGGVRCWGNGAHGAIGDGATDTRATPAATVGIGAASAVGVGEDHSCALSRDGVVACWGWDYFGQVGDPTETDRLTPTPVDGISRAVQLSASQLFNCTRLADATTWCWGYGADGQIGDGASANGSSARRVADLSGVLALGVGGTAYHACAMTADGAVLCWGQNLYGQLGDGTTENRATPVKVQGL